MKKSAYYSDIIFSFLLAFLFAVCLLRYLKVGIWQSVLVGILFGASAALFASKFLQKKSDKAILKKREETEAEKLALHLALLSPAKQASFFLPKMTAFSPNFENAFIRRPKRMPFIEGDNAVAFFRFTLEPIAADALLPFMNVATEKPVYLFCNDLTSETTRWCSRFSVTAIPIGTVYTTLKESDSLPESYLKENVLAAKKKRHIQLWFSKKNAVRFLTAGALLLLSSLLTPFPYYYLISACVLFAAAALVRTFGFEG